MTKGLGLLELVKKSGRVGLAGAKEVIVPGVALQLFALVLIVCYFNVASVRSVLDVVGGLNVSFYPWFGVLSTTLFGGVIPMLIESLYVKSHPQLKKGVGKVAYTLLYWAVAGAMIGAFYQVNAAIFGHDNALWTVVKKTLFDQFIWLPLIPAPMMVLCYLYRDVDFKNTGFREALAKHGYWERAIPVIIVNWMVWIPSTLIVYTLPSPLQLPVMNIILCIWSLMLTFISLKNSN